MDPGTATALSGLGQTGSSLFGKLKLTLTLAALFIVFAACGKNSDKADENEATLHNAQAKRDSYLAQMHAIQDAYGFVGTRCDGTTFTALLQAFAGTQIDLNKAEKQPGKWHRHPEKCYPDHSQSETSLDVYLMVLHWLQSNRNAPKSQADLSEIRAYGAANGWVMGKGALRFTNVAALLPLINKMEGQSFTDGPIEPLQGHKGHIAALYSLLHGRITGSITDAELTVLGHLHETDPTNPIYSAIYHRFKDGDFTDTIALALKFPDTMPVELNAWGWGSAPSAVFLTTAVGIMEGR